MLQCKQHSFLLGIIGLFLFSVFINSRTDVWKILGSKSIPTPKRSHSYILEQMVMGAKHTNSTTRHPLVPPYPYGYTFIINQPDKCKEKTPFLVILVIIQGKDIAARDAIRRTWGNESNVPGVSIARLFVTAISPDFDSAIQETLEEESRVHQDIIQQDFLDTYNNLTLKSLMGMEWVTKHCPNASYVLKIDGDMFLNVNYLVSSLLKPEVPARKNYISGHVVPNGWVYRLNDSKYYVPKEVYLSDRYPPYVAGGGYVFSGDMAKKIYDVAQTIQLIHMEDAFVGLCLDELKVKITKPSDGLFMWHPIQYDRCRFHTLITVHPYSPEELLKIWQDFQNNHNAPCPTVNN